MELTEAYRQCERITWSQARNFAYGIRLLPPPKRRGLAVIYAFARRIDDIGDGTLPAHEKIAALEAARRQILDLTRPPADDPVLLALADVERDFPVPMAAFGELIDGCVADVRGTSYQTFDDLLYYCRCVAGSIGRLSLGIFGTSHDAAAAAELAQYCELSANPVGEMVLYIFGAATPERIKLSDSICTALQLAEHWQDVAEDLANGRIYLPADDLEHFKVTVADLAEPAAGPAVRNLMRFETDRARQLLDEGAPLVGTLRGAGRLAVAGYLAGGRAALAAIRAQGYDVLSATARPRKPRMAAELVKAYARGR